MDKTTIPASVQKCDKHWVSNMFTDPPYIWLLHKSSKLFELYLLSGTDLPWDLQTLLKILLYQREPWLLDTSIPTPWLHIQLIPLRICASADLVLPQVTKQNKGISPLWQVIILVFLMYPKQ